MYHKKSPIYPLELFNDLLNVSNINESSKILEIGTSNSLATLPLFLKGMDVTSVEISSTKQSTENNQRIQFKNLSYSDLKLTDNSFDLVYVTKPIYINQEKYFCDKTYDLLDFSGKLAIIEIKPCIIPENKELNLLEKQLLIEFFNYTEDMVKNRILIEPQLCVKDYFRILFHKVYYKKIIYTKTDYEFYLKSFPEFANLDTEKQKYIFDKINKTASKICPEGKIAKEYAFILTILEKNEQTQLQLNT
jgi:ubiquinone/menaquinone biosynthesis C-methylase UbiE